MITVSAFVLFFHPYHYSFSHCTLATTISCKNIEEESTCIAHTDDKNHRREPLPSRDEYNRLFFPILPNSLSQMGFRFRVGASNLDRKF